MKRQACALAPDGAHVAAWRHRASVASSTRSSVNRRIVRAVDITSQTSLLGPVMQAPSFARPSRIPRYRTRLATKVCPLVAIALWPRLHRATRSGGQSIFAQQLEQGRL